MRWRKIRAVASFELRSTVRRLGYVVVTLGMPLFALMYAALALIPGYLVSQQVAQTRHFGVVDDAGVLALGPGSEHIVGHAVFRTYADERAARRALSERGEIRAYYRLPRDYLEHGAVEGHGPARAALGAWDARDELGELIRERLLSKQLSERARQRVVKPIAQRKSFRVTASGASEPEGKNAFLGRLLVPVGFVLLLFSSIVMSGSYLIQATATEKENRVVEVLLSSASADEIMTGKLLGLGAAGLLQVFLWGSMSLSIRLGFSGMLEPFDVRVPWQALALGPVLFVLAYAFIGSLMLGTGSFGGNVRESQQLGMLWALLATLPLLFLPVILAEPHGTAARILTWIPFSAPATIVLRVSLDPAAVSPWEIVGALALLVVATLLSLRLASRLFRVGLLLGGPRPSLREIWRQARGAP